MQVVKSYPQVIHRLIHREMIMNQADKDAAKWLEMNQRVQQQNLYKAKEQGDAYYINQFGEVVIPQEGKPAVIVKRDELCGDFEIAENKVCT